MRTHSQERGAALLVVVMAVAVLTALAAELAYTSQVRLQLAADARDELRATWLAKSAIQTERLILSFQQQLSGGASAAASAVSSTTTTPTTTGQTPQAAVASVLSSLLPSAGGLSIRLWSLVPVNSVFTAELLGGASPDLPSAADGASAPPPPAALSSPSLPALGRLSPTQPTSQATSALSSQPAPGSTGGSTRGSPATSGPPPLTRFGDFEGNFDATVEDEGAKVNVQLDSLQTGTLGPEVLALYELICDPRWDPIFDRTDPYGQRNTRQDIITHLYDWVDADSVTSNLVAAFPGAACLAVVPPKPFETGFGDENSLYDRGPTEERYKAKNSRLDSVDELYLVAGVSDAFMAAFGDRLTVYLPKDASRTIDPSDPNSLLELAMCIADPPGQAMLFDPEFKLKLQRAVMQQTMGGLMGLSPQDFATILRALGITVSPSVTTPGSPQSFLSASSTVYRIHATGQAGQVTSHLDVVVSFDPTQNINGPPIGKNLGRIEHWQEQ